MIVRAELPALTETQIKTASVNYERCLNLTPRSNVLIVTDELPQDQLPLDPNMKVRNQMTNLLFTQLYAEGHNVGLIRFSEETTRDNMQALALRALYELDPLVQNQTQDSYKPMSVVYLGEAWANRPGLYAAADEFGKKRIVRFAGSLGFSTGDCRVMSQIGPEQLRIIAETNRYFNDFFNTHPAGTFNVCTTDANGKQHNLHLNYDTSVVPFGTDLSQIGEGYGKKIGNRFYANIPGGERYTAPYPFRNTEGQFVAEGLIFQITEGKVVSITVPDNINIASLAANQRQLIEVVNAERHIPVAELGLGFYAIAGIETYFDSSILSAEKGGPHIGFGHDVSESPEADEMTNLSGDFHHTDFVLNNPAITFIDPHTNEEIFFYPPQK